MVTLEAQLLEHLDQGYASQDIVFNDQDLLMVIAYDVQLSRQVDFVCLLVWILWLQKLITLLDNPSSAEL